MWSSLAFAGFLVCLSVVMTVQHVRARRVVAEGEDSDPRLVEFARRQFRRRMLASITIGAIGLAVAGGIFIRDPLTSLLYWCGVFFAALWVALLALLDVINIRLHFGTLQGRQREAYNALRDELHRIRARRQNGRSAAGNPLTGNSTTTGEADAEDRSSNTEQ